MTAKEVIILLSKQQGITQEELAARLGFDRASNISTPLSRNDGMGMRLETFIRWLEVLDAQMIIQPLNEDDELILDGEDEGVTYA